MIPLPLKRPEASQGKPRASGDDPPLAAEPHVGVA